MVYCGKGSTWWMVAVLKNGKDGAKSGSPDDLCCLQGCRKTLLSILDSISLNLDTKRWGDERNKADLKHLGHQIRVSNVFAGGLCHIDLSEKLSGAQPMMAAINQYSSLKPACSAITDIWKNMWLGCVKSLQQVTKSRNFS